MTTGSGPRVVSLVPSVTETLLAWGVAPVGVSRFCLAPGVPTVGGTKNPDVPAIQALGPDLVVMDREENRKEDAEAIQAHGMTVIATHVCSIEDVGPALNLLAEAVGVSRRVEFRWPDPPAAGLSVWVPIWRRPWMTISGSTYGGSLLRTAGFHNVFEAATDRYPLVEVDEVTQRRPRFVLAPSEPYPFAEKHRADLEQVAPAVFADGQDLFWWGVRSPAALSRLSDLAAALRQRQVSEPTS